MFVNFSVCTPGFLGASRSFFKGTYKAVYNKNITFINLQLKLYFQDRYVNRKCVDFENFLVNTNQMYEFLADMG